MTRKQADASGPANPTHPVAQRRPVKPLDPNSERGKRAAHNAGVIAAGVIARLRREGKPVPGIDYDPLRHQPRPW